MWGKREENKKEIGAVRRFLVALFGPISRTSMLLRGFPNATT